MKKLYTMLTALVAAVAFNSCSVDNDPFITAGEDDYPRILNTELEETSGGKPSKLPTIDRTQNFTFEAIVTPTQFTTVSWFIDGEKVHEGNKIDMPMLAGDYDVKIVATTTKGLSTYRNCTLKVVPLEGDPALAAGAKNHWCQIGTTKVMAGTDLDGITQVFINNIECVDVVASEDGTSLSFDVTLKGLCGPGEYQMSVVKDGVRYGMGKVTVSEEPFKEDTAEKVLWEGDWQVTWDTPFKDLQEQAKAWFADGTWKEGTTIRVYVNGNGQGTVATAWWNNPFTGIDGEANRGDLPISSDTKYLEFTFTDKSEAMFNNQDGMFIVGNGYNISKITMLVSENVVWEGNWVVTWDTPFKELQNQAKDFFANGTWKEGTTLLVTALGSEGGQGTVATAWWNNPFTGIDGEANRGDIPFTEDKVYEFIFTDKSADHICNQDGMFLVGNGYTITKIAYK